MKKKRGAPKKPKGQRKSSQVVLRVSPSERQAFAAAANLDGKKTSEWIRDRLRRDARQELEASGQKVPFIIGPGSDLGVE
jgi:uncharacterized protein (DUF1778 family)